MTVPTAPAPFPEPVPSRRPVRGVFTVPLVDGGVHAEVCPAGCVTDHSSDARGAFLEDLVHHLGGEVSLSLRVEGAVEGTTTLPILRAQVQVDPYSSDPRTRVPHVVLESVGEVVSGLDPGGLEAVINALGGWLGQMRGMHRRLVEVRRGYSGR